MAIRETGKVAKKLVCILASMVFVPLIISVNVTLVGLVWIARKIVVVIIIHIVKVVVVTSA